MRATVFLALLLVVAGCGVRPSGIITGTAAPQGETEGVVLYFVSDGAVVPVVRPDPSANAPGATMPPGPSVDRFALLAAGPSLYERDLGLTTDVPPEAATATIAGNNNGWTLTLPIDVTTLSDLAVEQLACTAAPGAPVTLTGAGATRNAVACDLRPSRASGRPPAAR